MTQASIRDLPSIFDEWAVVRRRMIVTCARELRRLAARRKDFGVTATDVRQIALRRGYATGSERAQRALSWFAAVPKTARLHNTGRKRLGVNRNQHAIYVLR